MNDNFLLWLLAPDAIILAVLLALFLFEWAVRTKWIPLREKWLAYVGLVFLGALAIYVGRRTLRECVYYFREGFAGKYAIYEVFIIVAGVVALAVVSYLGLKLYRNPQQLEGFASNNDWKRPYLLVNLVLAPVTFYFAGLAFPEVLDERNRPKFNMDVDSSFLFLMISTVGLTILVWFILAARILRRDPNLNKFVVFLGWKPMISPAKISRSRLFVLLLLLLDLLTIFPRIILVSLQVPLSRDSGIGEHAELTAVREALPNLNALPMVLVMLCLGFGSIASVHEALTGRPLLPPRDASGSSEPAQANHNVEPVADAH